MDKWYYTAASAARYCNMSRNTFYRYRRAGRVKIYARKVPSGTIRFAYKQSDLDRIRIPVTLTEMNEIIRRQPSKRYE